jgi:hypothetical protein
MAERIRRRKDDYRALLDRLPNRRDIVETGNDSWRFKSRDDDQATRARLASAIPASSDETSATGKPRRAKGSKLDADEVRTPIDTHTSQRTKKRIHSLIAFIGSPPPGSDKGPRLPPSENVGRTAALTSLRFPNAPKAATP